MPTLIRFLVVVIVLAALAGAAVVYLAYFVHPTPHEMTVRIPPDKLGQ
jgi:phage shock protein PspC (stress-responsive transcriptional regulator)